MPLDLVPCCCKPCKHPLVARTKTHTFRIEYEGREFWFTKPTYANRWRKSMIQQAARSALTTQPEEQV